MFQSLNYFKYLVCPLSGSCTRPYCVFKHKIEQAAEDAASVSSPSVVTSKTEADNSDLALTLEKVKSLINSCDASSIDPGLLKKQLDDLLSKSISKASPSKQNNKSASRRHQSSCVPEYNPTPIHELNRIKSREESKIEYSTDSLEYDIGRDDHDDGEDDLNENNKRTLTVDDDDDTDVKCKKSKTFEAASQEEERKESENELKKLLQQKTESVIRKMNNPMSYIAVAGAPSALKIDKTSLQQQLMKRYETIAAQKAKQDPTKTAKPSSAASSSAKPPANNAVTQPKLIIDATNKVPLSFRQRYLNFIFEESKSMFPTIEKACEKAAEQEKSIYDRAKTRTIYANLAAHLVKSLREQNKKPSTATAATASTSTSKSVVATKYNLKTATTVVNKNSLKLVNKEVVPKVAYSHEAILAGAAAAKVSYSINRKKTLTLKDLNLSQLYNMLKIYILTEKQLEDNGFPLVFNANDGNQNKLLAYIPKPATQQATISKYSIQNHTITNAKFNSSTDIRLCKRCSKTFTISKEFEYTARDECVHHWGKLRKVRVNKAIEQRYSCCGQDSKGEGCQNGKHVYEGDDYEPNQPLNGYVQTGESMNEDAIYALDCEMCYTTKGLELTRVSVIDTKLKSVYETIVVPDHEILDYNTRWSGLTKDSFKNCRKKLKDVQNDLLKMFSTKTILMGHSLESDFKALKLVHKTVLDTSVMFPHKMGLPFKRALRNLACEHLQKFIQEDTSGHDSKEDACACMELVLWKVEQDLKQQK